MRRLTRRTLLSGIAAGTIGAAGAGRVRADDNRSGVTVATRNCYLGADLFALFAAAAEGREALRTAVSDLVETVDRSHVGRRLDAIAAEIGRTQPHLVGVQEAALIRTGPRTDGTTPTATDVRYDFRERLLSALEARDLPYRVVAATETVDFQLPATIDGEDRGVRLTDRDLVLARDDVSTADPVTGTFDATLSVTEGDRTITIDRGYGVVEASVNDRTVTFCNTHLESAAAGTRTEQAAELLETLADRPGPTVLVGDCNSGPGASTRAYDRLTETFDDVASDAGVGDTCCHAADLRNADPSLDARIDHVLVRGGMRAAEATRVGAAPTERIDVDGERLWPSDHAGVVATLIPAAEAESTATATPKETGTPSTTAAEPETGTAVDTDVAAPGLDAATAVVALAASAGAAVAARRGDDD